MRIYKLKFLSALHVDARGSGEPEVAEEFIRSDTLSAALSIGWKSVYPDQAGAEFFFNPPFKVSSAYPYVGDLLLFPTPVWRIWKTNDDLERKKMKKIRWISPSLFQQVLDGQEIQTKDIHCVPGDIAVSENDMNAYPQLKQLPFWVMTERQRVSVDRLMSKTEGLFFFALQFFNSGSGLWFAADADPPVYQNIRNVLQYLGDTGIGSDRNSGLGHFKDIKEGEFPFQAHGSKEGWLTLSLFNPGELDPLEKLTSSCAYGMTTRSGWISGSTVGRLPIRVFTEGSYFSQAPVGRVVDTLPHEIVQKFKLPISHTAPRDFRAISLPCAAPRTLKGDGI